MILFSAGEPAVWAQSLRDLDPVVTVLLGQKPDSTQQTGSGLTQFFTSGSQVVEVIVTPDGRLVHAGIHFPPMAADVHFNRFLSRLAYASRSFGPEQVDAWLMTQGFKFRSKPDRVTESRFDPPVNLIKQDMGWTVEYASGLILDVPANFPAISGMEKETLDNMLANQIRKPERHPPVYTQPGPSVPVHRSDSVSWVPGFYRTAWFAGSAALFSGFQPGKSLINLVTAFQGQGADLPVQLVHHTYGGETAAYTATWYGVYSALLEGNACWVGRETPDELSLTIVAQHPEFHYIHLLVLRAPAGWLSGSGEPAQLELFTYIRQDNLDSWLKTMNQSEAGRTYRIKR